MISEGWVSPGEIENLLARLILAGDFAEGDTIRVEYTGDEFTFEQASAAAPVREAEPVAAAV